VESRIAKRVDSHTFETGDRSQQRRIADAGVAVLFLCIIHYSSIYSLSSFFNMSTDSSTSCRLLFRSKEGLEIFTAPNHRDDPSIVPSDEKQQRNWLLTGSTTLQVFHPDGSRVYVHQPGVGVCMCTLDETKQVSKPFLSKSDKIQMLAISPKGSFLVSWERPESPQANNLKVWDSVSGEYLCGFHQKVLKREGWPYLHFTHDEMYAFLMVTNEIRVYKGESLAAAANHQEVRFVDKMRCPGISSMSVPAKANVSSYLLSTFVSATKDKPARASLHQYPSSQATAAPNAQTYPSLLSKSIFQAEEVTVHWSPKGDAALMALQTSVDTSGESYYGSTTLYLFAEESSDVVSVPLPNNSTGPVLDVSWMTNADKPPCFAVISGRMPAMASLHHGSTAEPIFLFGNAHRNTIAWSEHGRFLSLCGFGNLSGGMTFWDRNKLKPIPQYDPSTGAPFVNTDLSASCTVGYGWSPDSRLFMVSTTSPRMNVDNGVRLFRYNGEELMNTPWDNANYKPDKLLEAAFVPSLPDVYPDRPQSPPPKVTGEHAETVAQAKEAVNTVSAKPVSSSGTKKYVPPSARGRSGGTSLAERMRREKEQGMMGATKVVNKPKVPGAATAVGGKSVVGLVPKEEGKSKSAIKKEKQKLAKKKREEEEARTKAEEEAAAAEAVQATANDPEKRAKKIKKTLRQIEDLKEKDAASLNEDQKKKIASEDGLRKELASLGINE
jgi:translation initiation factor 2A